MSRALAMAVAGKACSRTCRGCGELMRIERFAKSATLKSGYGWRCRPCVKAYSPRRHGGHGERRGAGERHHGDSTAEDAEGAEGNGHNGHKNHNGQGAEGNVHKELPLRTSAPSAVPRDTRYRERKRRCLGPCHELFLSSHCAHRFCPRCVDLVDRSPDSEEHWGDTGVRGEGSGVEDGYGG